MNRFILDASIGLSWFVDHPVPPEAEHARSLFSQGWRALVPAIWALEMINGLVKAERRQGLSSAEVKQSFTDLQRMKIFIHADQGFASQEDILDHARSLQLTSYDASYVELALREGLPLATLDKALQVGAAKAGVKILK